MPSYVCSLLPGLALIAISWVRFAGEVELQAQREKVSMYWGVAKRNVCRSSEVTFDYKVHKLGLHNSEQDAAVAFDCAAVRLRGE